MRGLQVDNQLPLTPMPVLFRPQRAVAETDYILKLSMTMQSNGSLDLCVYPYIGLHVSSLKLSSSISLRACQYFVYKWWDFDLFHIMHIFWLIPGKQGPENSASFLINIHEPIIWRLHEMIQQVKLSRLYDSQTTAASVDSIIQIGYAKVLFSWGFVVVFISLKFFWWKLEFQCPQYLGSSAKGVYGHVTQSKTKGCAWVLVILNDCIGKHRKHACKYLDAFH